MNFKSNFFSYSINEDKFFSEFKQEFYTEKTDYNHSYNFDNKHPNIIKIGCIDVGCIALQGLSNTDSPAIRVVYLFIYKQNIGTGSLILSKLCELADKYNVILELDAIPQKQTKNSISREKLISWYQRFGFNLVIEDYHLMRRYIKPDKMG
jgi:hypothetical protein